MRKLDYMLVFLVKDFQEKKTLLDLLEYKETDVLLQMEKITSI